MKTNASLLFGLFSLAIAAPLVGSEPALLTVKYKGQMLPVVKVIDSDPVVMVDGRAKRIRTTPSYQPQAGGRFSPDSVTIVSASLDGNKPTGVAYSPDFGGPLVTRESFRPEIKLTLQAPQTLQGAFIVVSLSAPPPTLRNFWIKNALVGDKILVVRELPTLTAGANVPVQIADPYLTYLEEADFDLQIFDAQGRQILTNPTNQI